MSRRTWPSSGAALVRSKAMHGAHFTGGETEAWEGGPHPGLVAEARLKPPLRCVPGAQRRRRAVRALGSRTCGVWPCSGPGPPAPAFTGPAVLPWRLLPTPAGREGACLGACALPRLRASSKAGRVHRSLVARPSCQPHAGHRRMSAPGRVGALPQLQPSTTDPNKVRRHRAWFLGSWRV